MFKFLNSGCITVDDYDRDAQVLAAISRFYKILVMANDTTMRYDIFIGINISMSNIYNDDDIV